MLKRFLGFITGNKSNTKSPTFKLQVTPRDHHAVSRKDISASALKVLYRLNEAGYDAFLVGGGVRDLLLGLHPKDFDVATNATPEQVKSVFRNCRIIGRRFRLAHVHFGPEIIEVATFRSSHDKAEEDHAAQTSNEGLILRDNVWGTLEEDALRRDFTVNALYYSVKDFGVYDYAGGMQDIQSRTLRMIGDPETRFREDPVRMLRAARFAAKLDFDVAEQTARPIRHLGQLLQHVPAARLFDEVLKLFMAGKGVATLDWLIRFDLLQYLVPAAAHGIRENPVANTLIRKALESTDLRVQQDKPVTPAFLFAALLWPEVSRRTLGLQQEHGLPPLQALHAAAHDTLEQQMRHTAVPKRFSLPVREIWDMQMRLTRRNPRRAGELVSHPRFRAAYDFLLLREAAGEDTGGMGHWWSQFLKDNPAPVQQTPDNLSFEESQELQEPLGSTDDRPRKRRPRRRRPPRRSASPAE